MMDFQPPDLWLPPKPAIIRAHKPLARANLIGFCIPMVVSAAAPEPSTPPAYASKGAVTADFASVINVSFPAVVNANDIALFVQTADSNPSGWGGTTGFTPIASAVGGSTGARLLYKRCTGSEDGTSVTFDSNGTAGTCSGQIFTISGAIVSGTPYEDASVNSGASTTMTSNATTISGAARLGIRIYCQGDNRASTPPSGWTEQSEDADVVIQFMVSFDTKEVAAGTEGATSRTISGSEDWVVFDLAMIPNA